MRFSISSIVVLLASVASMASAQGVTVTTTTSAAAITTTDAEASSAAPTTTRAGAPAPASTDLISIIEPFENTVVTTGAALRVSWTVYPGQNVQNNDVITWRWQDIRNGPNTGTPFGDVIRTGPVSESRFTINIPAGLASGTWGLRAELASFPGIFQYSPAFIVQASGGAATTTSARPTTSATVSKAPTTTAKPTTTAANTPSGGVRSLAVGVCAVLPALVVLAL
ncbi:hypothetical protein HDU67_003230 [Dinochytrium kinnereticum]|nr:hypothetical protein HDU67_003230 [Dinochytrium kinnereticum]